MEEIKFLKSCLEKDEKYKRMYRTKTFLYEDRRQKLEKEKREEKLKCLGFSPFLLLHLSIHPFFPSFFPHLLHFHSSVPLSSFCSLLQSCFPTASVWFWIFFFFFSAPSFLLSVSLAPLPSCLQAVVSGCPMAPPPPYRGAGLISPAVKQLDISGWSFHHCRKKKTSI